MKSTQPPAEGIPLSPGDRPISPGRTVEENRQLAQIAPPIGWSLDRIYELFPRLGERRKQEGVTLSGGEQQMLAISRALMARPRLLLLDEPSLGMAPLIIKKIFEIIKKITHEQTTTVFLVEQNAYHTLNLADRGYVMVNGKITMSGTGQELLERKEVRAAYLEGGAALEQGGPK